MSTSEDPGRRPDTASPTPGAAPEPGATTGPRDGESAAQHRSADRKRERERGGGAGNMLPGRSRRRFGLERLIVRLIATGGVIGVGVALGAILAASKVQGWIIGLVIALVSVVLSGMLWSSRQL